MLEVYNVAVLPLLARDKLLCAVVKQAVAVERLAAVPLRYRDNYLDKPVVAVGVVLVAVYQREVEQAVLLVSGNFSSESFLRALYALLVVYLLRLYLYLAEVKTYARFALSFMLNAGVAIIVVIFSSSGVSGLVSTSLSLALSLSKGLLSSLASPMQMNGISCLIA